VLTAEYIKEVGVTLPDGDTISLEIYMDPRTRRFFGIEVDFVEGGREITSPFNPRFKLKLE